jgi:uncharacterized protein DUF1761
MQWKLSRRTRRPEWRSHPADAILWRLDIRDTPETSMEIHIMQQFPINWWAVLAATVVKFMIGGMWFSPLLFLRPWQQLTGQTDESMKSNMAIATVKWIISSFIMAFVLLHAVHYAGASGLLQGAEVGFANWLGFIFVVQWDMNTATKAPFKLLALNTGSQLVSLLIMGAIFATWT